MTTLTPPSSQDSQRTIIYTPPNNQIVQVKSPEIAPIAKRNLNLEFGVQSQSDQKVSNSLQNIMCKQAGSVFMGTTFTGCMIT